MLWEASHNDDYVANPEIGAGSLHSWGIAIDATLVDSRTRDVPMPRRTRCLILFIRCRAFLRIPKAFGTYTDT